MSSQYRVRVADESDANEIARVHNESFGNLINSYGSRYSYSTITEQDVIRWMTDPNYTESIVFVIEETEIHGYAHCVLQIEKRSQEIPVLYFHSTGWDFGQARIGVLPDKRRQGLGSTLVKTAIDNELSISPQFVIAFAYENNVEGRALFTKVGFQQHDLFMLERYSEKEPLTNGSVLAKFDLTKTIPQFESSINVNIRRADESDTVAIARLDRANIWWNPETWTTQWASRFIKGEFSHIVFVAEFEGDVVGVMNYTPHTGEVGFTGVLPEFQRKGIGSYFMTQLLSKMKEAGIHEAIAASGLTQVDAIRLYHRLGFEILRKNAFVLEIGNNQ